MAQPELTSQGDAPPPRIGRFTLGWLLSRGAAGDVYEATESPTERCVFVLLPPTDSLVQSRDRADRFVREAQAVTRLTHPAILAPTEFGFAEDGQPYLVLERRAGETLRTRLQRGGPLLVSEALPLLTQIADALQYAHGRGILHRDVRPDNIFLSADGAARLMGFEIACLSIEDGLTQTGAVIGSPAYLSPEQIGGLTLDGRSDVFSLAVTAAEALTGRRPFEAPDIPSVMHQILHKPPQLAGVGSRPLRRALEQALAKAPSARTPSAGALAGALRQAAPPFTFASSPGAAGPLVAPTTPVPGAMPSDRGRPRRWGAAAAIALAALLFGALPLIRRHHTALPTTAVRQASGGRTAVRPPGILSEATAAQDKGSAWIVETTPPTPRPKSPPPEAIVLQALRDAPAAPIALPRPFPVARTTAYVPPPFHAQSPPPSVAPPPMTTPPVAVPPVAVPPDAVLYGMGMGDRFQAPHLIHHADPALPSGTNRAAGTARLLVSVNVDGNVSDARVVQSSGNAGLDDAAIATALRWQYAPATHDGRPVSANVAETVTFGSQ